MEANDKEESSASAPTSPASNVTIFQDCIIGNVGAETIPVELVEDRHPLSNEYIPQPTSQYYWPWRSWSENRCNASHVGSPISRNSTSAGFQSTGNGGEIQERPSLLRSWSNLPFGMIPIATRSPSTARSSPSVGSSPSVDRQPWSNEDIPRSSRDQWSVRSPLSENRNSTSTSLTRNPIYTNPASHVLDQHHRSNEVHLGVYSQVQRRPSPVVISSGEEDGNDEDAPSTSPSSNRCYSSVGSLKTTKPSTDTADVKKSKRRKGNNDPAQTRGADSVIDLTAPSPEQSDVTKSNLRFQDVPSTSAIESKDLLTGPSLEQNIVTGSSVGYEDVPSTSSVMNEEPVVFRCPRSPEQNDIARTNVRFQDDRGSNPSKRKEVSETHEETLILKRSKQFGKFEVVCHDVGAKGKADESPDTHTELLLHEKIAVDLLERVCDGSKIFKGIHHGRCKEVVAIKIITKYTEDNEHEVKNLKSASEHENVVTYYCSGFTKYRDKKAIYIAMELCDNDTLEKRIKNPSCRREFAEKVEEIYQIARGLDHLHNVCRILHRDLKPPNILYKNGVCKISDFGLSKRLPPGKSNTRQSMANVGTDGWRAPETSDCEANSTPASDVYALGLVSYYDLTDGKHPFGNHEGSRQCYIRENRNLSLKGCEKMPDSEVFHDLFSSVLSHNPSDRLSIKEVCKHPAFWTVEKKLKFYSCIVKYEDYAEEQGKQNQRPMRSGRKTPGFTAFHLKSELDSKTGKYGDKVLRCSDWKDSLTLDGKERKTFKRGGVKPNADCIKQKATGRKGKSSFDGKSVFSLIKFIRNRDSHGYQDRAVDDCEISHENLWKFCSKRYCWLLIYAYNTVKRCLNEKNSDFSYFKEIFQEYF